MNVCPKCDFPLDDDPPATPEQHVAGLEDAVEEFARRLTAAQDAGVSHAILIPRMMLAFRRTFGEPPPGFTLPAGLLPGGVST